MAEAVHFRFNTWTEPNECKSRYDITNFKFWSLFPWVNCKVKGNLPTAGFFGVVSHSVVQQLSAAAAVICLL